VGQTGAAGARARVRPLPQGWGAGAAEGRGKDAAVERQQGGPRGERQHTWVQAVPQARNELGGQQLGEPWALPCGRQALVHVPGGAVWWCNAVEVSVLCVCVGGVCEYIPPCAHVHHPARGCALPGASKAGGQITPAFTNTTAPRCRCKTHPPTPPNAPTPSRHTAPWPHLLRKRPVQVFQFRGKARADSDSCTPTKLQLAHRPLQSGLRCGV